MRTFGIAAILLLLWPFVVRGAERPNIVVIFTDDHGYADLGCQGQVDDVRTPRIDELAAAGVRCTAGYVTAPQCMPSRAGLLTGRYQQRFGLEDNLRGPLPPDQVTLAERLAEAGYQTGMVGKWHLDLGFPNLQNLQQRGQVERYPRSLPGAQGFSDYFCGEMRSYLATFDLAGQSRAKPTPPIADQRFRVDVQTEAALAYVDRHAPSEQPFFLYLAYFAPHVPLEATDERLEQFADVKEPQRRQALAMIAAMDEGVGRLRERLAQHGELDNTLVFLISDNGAPLKKNAWDGSLNTPWVGEKGMLTDGGIRVPYLVSWPQRLPKSQVFAPMVSSLDVATTALAAAGVARDNQLDGVDLVPHLTGDNPAPPHEVLYWRWRSQAAIRSQDWKLVGFADRGWQLFHVAHDAVETTDVATEHPDIVASLKTQLLEWASQLSPPGLPKELHPEDAQFFSDHLKTVP